jgi:hypothetical protein
MTVITYNNNNKGQKLHIMKIYGKQKNTGSYSGILHTELVRDSVQWRCLLVVVMNLWFPLKAEKLLTR